MLLLCSQLVLAMLMELVPDDKAKGLKTPVWDEYKKIINEVKGNVNCSLHDSS